jgi:hypothetical protein
MPTVSFSPNFKFKETRGTNCIIKNIGTHPIIESIVKTVWFSYSKVSNLVKIRNGSYLVPRCIKNNFILYEKRDLLGVFLKSFQYIVPSSAKFESF